jgi:hypothetical protein
MNDSSAKLNAKLKELGLTLTRAEKSKILSLHPSSVARYLKKLVATKLYTLNGQPVHKLELIDGRTSVKSYAIASIKAAAGMVAVRRFSTYNKVKFYPNFEVLGFTAESLQELGATYPYTRDEYQGCYMSDEVLDKFLTDFGSQRSVDAAPAEHVIAVASGQPISALGHRSTTKAKPRAKKKPASAKASILKKRPVFGS